MARRCFRTENAGHVVVGEISRMEEDAIRLESAAFPKRRPGQDERVWCGGKQIKAVNQGGRLVAGHAIPAKRSTGGNREERVTSRRAGLCPLGGGPGGVDTVPHANESARSRQRAKVRLC